MKKIIILAMLLISGIANAANVKISELDAATSAAGTDELVINQGGTSKKITNTTLFTNPAVTGNITQTGTLGANSIINGTFDTDASWTKGAGWTIDVGDSNNAIATATTGNLSETASTVVAGKYYKLTWDAVNTSGTYQILAGGRISGIYSITGSYVWYFFAVTTGAVTFDGVTSFTGTIDNVVLKEVSASVNVDDAIMATTSGTQPLVIKKTLDDATGDQAAVHLSYTTNKATAGNDTGLLIDMLDTASPGLSYLMNAQVGGASKFHIRSDGSFKGGNMSFGINATNRIEIAEIRQINGSSTLKIYDQNFNVAGTNIQLGGGSTITNTSGNYFHVSVLATYNQASGSDANTDFLINRTETALQTGAQRLISAGTGGGSYTEKWGVSNTGATIEANGATKALSFTKTSLTNNSAVDLFTITLAAGESVAGKFFYGITSTGGSSDIQVHSGDVTFVCANKGGTFSSDIDEVYLAANETQILTAGTQADTWAMKAGNVCTVTLNVNSSLSSAVNTVSGRILLYSDKVITLN